MVDLIDVQRNGGDRVTIFGTVEELRDYTVETSKFFPMDSLESGAILRHLLRPILHANGDNVSVL